MVESTSVQIKCHHGLFYAIFCVKVKQSILFLVKCLVCASVYAISKSFLLCQQFKALCLSLLRVRNYSFGGISFFLILLVEFEGRKC